MATGRPLVPAFTAPTTEEAWALTLAAAYLSRAATETASRLIPAAPLLHGQVELLATLRDNLWQSASLCECLLAVFDDWPMTDSPVPPREPPGSNGHRLV